MQEFYIAREGEAYGPVSFDDTSRMYLDGRFDRDSLVWDPEASDWVLASNHPEISRIFAVSVLAEETIEEPQAVAIDEVRDDTVDRRAAIADEIAALEANLEASRTAQASVEGELRRLEEERVRSAEEARRIDVEKSAREAERDALVEELAKRREELKALEDERASRLADGKKIENELAKRREEIASLDAERASKASERKAIEEELARLSSSRAAAESEVSQANAECRRLNDESARLKAEAQRLDSLLKEIASRASEERARDAESAAARAKLAAEIEELSASRARITAEREGLEAQSRSRIRELEALNAGLADLRMRGESLAGELAGLEASIAAKRNEAAELEPLLERVTMLRDTKARLDADLSDSRRELEKAELERGACDEEVRIVRARLEEIRNETRELEAKRVEAQALLGREVAAAFDEIRTSMGELGRMTESWNEAQARDEEARRVGLASLGELRASLAQREAELDRLFGDLGSRSAAQTERDALAAQADEERARIERFREELKKITVLCFEESQRLDEYRAERDETRAEIDAEFERYADLETNLRALKDEAESVSGRLGTLTFEYSQLETEVEALKIERRNAEESIETLRRSRTELVDSCVKLEAEIAALSSKRAALEVENEARVESLAALHAEIELLSGEKEQLRIAAEADRALTARTLEDNETVRATAEEARREIEYELEEEMLKLSRAKDELGVVRADKREMERVRAELAEQSAGLTERIRVDEQRMTVVEGRRNELSQELDMLGTQIEEQRRNLAALRADEIESAEHRARLAVELEELGKDKALCSSQIAEMEVKLGKLSSDRTALERERAQIARLELRELRDLLATREKLERERIEHLLNEARTEFRQLKEEWTTEERLGVTNDELRRLRDEVEDKRRELVKAERQLSAMRAGLSKLREENGRNLLRRIQTFETQQLDDIKKRLGETRGEIETMESDWNQEMLGSELIEKQWIDIQSALADRQARA